MSKSIVLLAILFLSFGANGQNSEKVSDLLDRGLRSRKNGNYSAAIEDFSRVIELTSTLKPPSKERKYSETPEQAAQRENIRVIDPRAAEAYVYRGNLY